MAESVPLIVSISGIRGIVDQSLTLEVVHRFAAAFATTLDEGARVVVARDTRPSGERLARQTATTLQEAGCQVLELGICSTPGAKLMVTELRADGAIILTASHNPAPWNGLKLIRADGVFLNAEQGRRVEEVFHTGRFRRQSGGRLVPLDPADAKRRHLQRILAHVDVERIRQAGLSAAVDPCNGTGALLIPDLLDALGVRAAIINGQPDGRFAHEPEPVPANLVQLGAAVRATASAIGFAIDPDADRVSLVDERGRPVGEDYTLALAVQALTARQPGPVVTTLSTSQAVSDAARANGCPVILTPVGEVHVVEKMLEVGAAIGGEGNGGVILTQIDPGRDAAVGVAVILEAVARSRQPLSELVQTLPRYAIEKRKVTASSVRLAPTVAALQQRYPRAFVHPVQDGAKLYLNGDLECPWVHLRPSNTEPVVRIIAESARTEEASRLCDEVEELLQKEE
jgi:phosphomannomutase